MYMKRSKKQGLFFLNPLEFKRFNQKKHERNLESENYRRTLLEGPNGVYMNTVK